MDKILTADFLIMFNLELVTIDVNYTTYRHADFYLYINHSDYDFDVQMINNDSDYVFDLLVDELDIITSKLRIR